MRTSHSTAFFAEGASRPFAALSAVATDPQLISEFLRLRSRATAAFSPPSQFLCGMRAVALSVGSTFRQARLPGAPDTAFGISATSPHAAKRKR